MYDSKISVTELLQKLDVSRDGAVSTAELQRGLIKLLGLRGEQALALARLTDLHGAGQVDLHALYQRLTARSSSRAGPVSAPTI